jgi:hypothetical protein
MDAIGRSGDGQLIGFMIDAGVHAMALSVLALNGGEISGDGSADLSYITDPAAVYQSYQTGMNGEASAFQAMVDEYNDPATQRHVVSFVNQYIQFENPNTNSGSLTPAQIVSALQWIDQTEEALGGTLQETDAQFQQWLAQKQAEAASVPLAAITLESVTPSRTVAQSILVRNLM